MKKVLIAFAALFAVSAVSAQNVDMTGFVFPEFKQGDVMKTKGGTIAGPLNYDAIYQKMTYKDRSGDFYYLGDVKNILKVTIGDRIFVPSGIGEGFLEEVQVSGGKMYIQHRVEYKADDSNGPYGGSQTTASQSVSHVSISTGSAGMSGIGSGRFEMSKRGEIKDRTQYGVMADGKFKTVNSARGLVSVFGHKDEINAFVKDNGVKFNNFDDIKKIIEYCYSL